MSLLNEMLRDLDVDRRQPLPPNVKVAPAVGPAKKPKGGLLILAIVLVPLAFWIGTQWSDSPTVMSDIPEAAALQTFIPMEELAKEDERSAPLSLAVSDSHNELSHVVTELSEAKSASSERLVSSNTADDNAQSIANLLAAAHLALAADRLTTPINDNAFLRYQAVLLMEPNSNEALIGIQNIAARYLEFYQDKLKQQDISAASHYRRMAEAVLQNYPPLAASLSQELAIIAAAEIVPDELSTGKLSPKREDPTSTVAIAQANNVVRRPTGAELDRRRASEARALMQEGRHYQAERILLEHVAIDPEASESRRILFDIYLARGDVIAAEQQIIQGQNLSHHQRNHMTAQLAMAQGQLDIAIESLHSSVPDLHAAPDYYAYLAALYHQSARFSESAELYERLLGIDGNQPGYWLGLAVSLDAMGDSSNALQAFVNARRYSAADAPSRAYVDERIRGLSG